MHQLLIRIISRLYKIIRYDWYNDGGRRIFDIYNLPVVTIPTNKNVTKRFNDQIYRTEKEKYNAITNKIMNVIKGQPVLVGTTSIEKSEKISSYLKGKKLSIMFLMLNSMKKRQI